MTDASSTAPLLSLRGIERSFQLGQTRLRALRGIDLTVAAGEFMAIWGPSGSGKSTLLNLLGLIDQADQGLLCFEGQDVRQLSDDALSDCRNRRIGFVFQSFNLIPVLSALDNVGLSLQVQGVPATEVRRRATEWLEQVGLGDFLHFRPDRLSGGQRQRVAIARALVGAPRLLIADEPTANLDSQTSREVIDLIERLNRDTGVTCIFTTHDPRLLARVPRQLRLQDGVISQDSYQEAA
ncbi:ABC transporter ATP-binding protein [Curvibacter sp. HBC28]|uniref:ABC transporter ATP-binding protein n=1 Tax=Curvibacter microcysteis TaxID=3026419 RepID=A0ABT5MEJ3_9BURK|nr:ABC transporter ATP-binding protein [Curvibacter sp. HBC28]MDD0815000.1 ABC transporter ATP-binding protein [Curvibacter sp. HBC28]